jgi:hypothetical protein
LKALLNIWTPDSLCVRRGHVLVVLKQNKKQAR